MTQRPTPALAAEERAVVEVTNEYAYAGMMDTPTMRQAIIAEARSRVAGNRPHRPQVQRVTEREANRIKREIERVGGAVVDPAESWWEEVPPGGENG